MKRKVLSQMMILCLLTVFILPVRGAPAYMADEAGLLTGAEASDIEAKLTEISNRQGVDVVIVTVDSTDGQSPMDFADDYYDYNDYRADGILLLISVEDSDWWISTSGYGITAITDAGLDYISARFVPLLSNGEYARGFTEFAELCDTFITQAKTGDPYDTHNLPKESFNAVFSLILALCIGLVTALIVTGKMKSKLKTVRQQAKADHYVAAGSLQLTHSRDLFLYTHLDRREKAMQSSGSSTHTSSSGTTHGGGGGKF